MKITRSISIQVWRYGTLPACSAPELFEAGLRVDATAHGACATPQDAETLLALLNGALGHWLHANWAGRLLIAAEDQEARAYLQAHPKALGRPPAQLQCTSDEPAMARYLLGRVCPTLFSAHGLQVRELVLAIDPGRAVRMVLRNGQAGEVTCVAELASAVTVWTKLCDKTKFGLVQRQSRPAPGEHG